MFKSNEAHRFACLLEEGDIPELLDCAKIDVNCVANCPDCSYIVVSGFAYNEYPSISEVVSTITDICEEAVYVMHRQDPGEITIVLCDNRSADQLWFKVLFDDRCVFAQCRFHIVTNYLEVALGY